MIDEIMDKRNQTDTKQPTQEVFEVPVFDPIKEKREEDKRKMGSRVYNNVSKIIMSYGGLKKLECCEELDRVRADTKRVAAYRKEIIEELDNLIDKITEFKKIVTKNPIPKRGTIKMSDLADGVEKI